MPAVVVVGDKDSHDAPVTSGSAKTTVAGIQVATVGSTVASDKLGHSGKTITSHGNTGKTTVGGQAIATTGAKVSCGATVTATHNKTTAG